VESFVFLPVQAVTYSRDSHSQTFGLRSDDVF